MKKVILITAILAATLTSCRDTHEKETVIVREKTETAAPAETREGVLERSAKKVDKKVNDAIDKEIDKIGDDN